jgi:hypothetical protein
MQIIGVPGVSSNGQTTMGKGYVDLLCVDDLNLTAEERDAIEERESKRMKVVPKAKVDSKGTPLVDSLIGKYIRCDRGKYSGKVARVAYIRNGSCSVTVLGDHRPRTNMLANALKEVAADDCTKEEKIEIQKDKDLLGGKKNYCQTEKKEKEGGKENECEEGEKYLFVIVYM